MGLSRAAYFCHGRTLSDRGHQGLHRRHSSLRNGNEYHEVFCFKARGKSSTSSECLGFQRQGLSDDRELHRGRDSRMQRTEHCGSPYVCSNARLKRDFSRCCISGGQWRNSQDFRHESVYRRQAGSCIQHRNHQRICGGSRGNAQADGECLEYSR
jgi:hypothetical protein